MTHHGYLSWSVTQHVYIEKYNMLHVYFNCKVRLYEHLNCIFDGVVRLVKMLGQLVCLQYLFHCNKFDTSNREVACGSISFRILTCVLILSMMILLLMRLRFPKVDLTIAQSLLIKWWTDIIYLPCKCGVGKDSGRFLKNFVKILRHPTKCGCEALLSSKYASRYTPDLAN